MMEKRLGWSLQLITLLLLIGELKAVTVDHEDTHLDSDPLQTLARLVIEKNKQLGPPQRIAVGVMNHDDQPARQRPVTSRPSESASKPLVRRVRKKISGKPAESGRLKAYPKAPLAKAKNAPKGLVSANPVQRLTPRIRSADRTETRQRPKKSYAEKVGRTSYKSERVLPKNKVHFSKLRTRQRSSRLITSGEDGKEDSSNISEVIVRPDAPMGDFSPTSSIHTEDNCPKCRQTTVGKYHHAKATTVRPSFHYKGYSPYIKGESSTNSLQSNLDKYFSQFMGGPAFGESVTKVQRIPESLVLPSVRLTVTEELAPVTGPGIDRIDVHSEGRYVYGEKLDSFETPTTGGARPFQNSGRSARLTKEAEDRQDFFANSGGFDGFADFGGFQDIGSFHDSGLEHAVPIKHATKPPVKAALTKEHTYTEKYKAPEDLVKDILYVKDPWKDIEHVKPPSYITKPFVPKKPSYALDESYYKPPEPYYKPTEAPYKHSPKPYIYDKPTFRPPIGSVPVNHDLKPAIIEVHAPPPHVGHELVSHHESDYHDEDYHAPEAYDELPGHYNQPETYNDLHDAHQGFESFHGSFDVPDFHHDVQPHHESHHHIDHEPSYGHAGPTHDFGHHDFVAPDFHDAPFSSGPGGDHVPYHETENHHFSAPESLYDFHHEEGHYDSSGPLHVPYQESSPAHHVGGGFQGFSDFSFPNDFGLASENRPTFSPPPTSRRGAARLLDLPDEPHIALESSDQIEYGANTGSYGAFNWFSNHPQQVIGHLSSR